MKKIRMTGRLLLCVFFLLTAVSCGVQKEDAKNKFDIHYVNRDTTAVLYYEYETQSTEKTDILQELIAELERMPEKLEYQPPLAGGFKLLDYELIEGNLILNFDENYKNQELITEILTRAAIVRTLVQVPEAHHVSFLVNGEPLTDASGTVVGVMNRDTFIDNAGNEINAYERVKIQLYFANEEGDGLTAVTRNVVYSSNFSPERQVVEEIIAGPKAHDISSVKDSTAYPVMNPSTKIIGVTIKDGVCYVNLDNGFLNQVYDVSQEIPIYALTNSLVELPNVNKVQISINGETNVNYTESINLSTLFERNLDLVIVGKQ